jgi:hypothetical protein
VLYVTTAELTQLLGAGTDPARAELACSAVSEWIDTRTGRRWDDPFAGPVPARIHQLALNGAARFYHDPEAPYGVIAASSDVPMYMRGLMTDADVLLLGLRSDFGLA